MKYFIRLTLIIITLTSIAEVKGQAQKPLKNSIEDILKDRKIAGCIVTVVSRDSVLFQSTIGYADIENTRLVEEHHLFQIASLTKTFTVMAIMRLIHENKLSLDDKLIDLAPEIPYYNKWKSTNPIKIKHLIEHKAGFGDYSFAHLTQDYDSHEITNSLDKIVKLKSSLESHWPPGLVTSYSNPSYSILAYIIEKKSGKSFNEYIHHEILKPLGMHHTTFLKDLKATNPSQIATGYIMQENKRVVAENTSQRIKMGSSGLLTTVSDMALFLQYLLNEEIQDDINILNTNGIRTMEKPHSKFGVENKISFGYNMSLEDRVFGQKNLLFKGNSGLTDGFVSNFIYSRDLNIGIFVSSNLFQVSNRKVIDLLVDHFCNSKAYNPPIRSKSNSSLSHYKDWEGEYRQLNDSHEPWNFLNFPLRTKSIEFTGNQILVSDVENGTLAYDQYSENSFLCEEYGDIMPSLYLTEYEGNKTILHNGNTYIPTSKVAYVILRSLLVISLFIIVLAIIVLILQILLYPFKKYSSRHLILKSIVYTLPFICIISSIYLSLSNMEYHDIPKLGRLSSTSISIFLLTIMYPIASISTLYVHIKKNKLQPKKIIKTYYSLVAFAITFISIYCVIMNWLAISFWS